MRKKSKIETTTQVTLEVTFLIFLDFPAFLYIVYNIFWRTFIASGECRTTTKEVFYARVILFLWVRLSFPQQFQYFAFLYVLNSRYSPAQRQTKQFFQSCTESTITLHVIRT